MSERSRRTIQLDYQALTSGQSFALETRGKELDAATVIRSQGRSIRVQGGKGHYLVAVALRGRIDLETIDGCFQLRGRHLLALPGESLIKASTRGHGDWLLLAVSPALLSELGRQVHGHRLPEPALFTAPARVSSLLLGLATSLIRHARRADSDPVELESCLRGLLTTAIQDQAPMEQWVERASGRTEGHRRQVVARLLRARSLMLNAPFERHALEDTCRAARYSKSHFIRLFRDVFGVTPHDFLSSVRVEMAKALILEGRMAITEIAGNVGFESRFAFSRLFKQRVGVSAGQYRQQVSRLARAA